MPDRVYITPKLERQLAQMEQQTSAPAVAAQRARQIIDSLIRGNAPVPGCSEGEAPVSAPGLPGERSNPGGPDGDGSDPVGAGLLRYRKDKRVKNSLKFNLGQGFRLICIKERKELFVMFAGDHDSSSAWLDRFTRKKPHRTEVDMRVFPVADPPAARPAVPASAAPARESFGDPLPKEIPQEVLRKVFRGLCAPG